MENKMLFSIMAGLIYMVSGDSHSTSHHQLTSYNQPSLTPSVTYKKEQPASSYSSSEPISSYSPSSNSYGETTSYEEESQLNPFDLSLIVIPILIVAGFSLLFPTTTNVTTRKRRNTLGKANTHHTIYVQKHT